MAIEGHIHDGAVVFDQPMPLAEGTRVRVEAVNVPNESGDGQSMLEILGDVVGAIDDAPADLAEQHDHYLYGTPKR